MSGPTGRQDNRTAAPCKKRSVSVIPDKALLAPSQGFFFYINVVHCRKEQGTGARVAYFGRSRPVETMQESGTLFGSEYLDLDDFPYPF